VVVADPAAELLALVRAQPDPAPAEAPPTAVARAQLIRRRFGMSLPLPFVEPPDDHEPVRTATALDGAAVAAVKWRAFGTSYRGGVLPDSFLDRREVVPPARYWVGRALVPPSRRHRLLVWGRPGTVYGYVDCGPAHADDVSAGGGDEVGDVGEVWELYVDPGAQRRGGGRLLLDAASAWLDRVGLSHQELSVLRSNPAAIAFYDRQGWHPTGEVRPVDLGVVAFEELRLRRAGPGSS
jgi:ribosomal protein S18 acetylase RimI-like enzyme